MIETLVRIRSCQLAVLVVFVVGTISCGSYLTAQTDEQLFVGEYVLTSGGDPEEFASFIALDKNKSATEVHVDRLTGSTRVIQTHWKTSLGTTFNVEIGDRSYPVWRQGSHIALDADSDRGMYFEKVQR